MKLLHTLISEIDSEAEGQGQTDLGQLRSPKDTANAEPAPIDGKRKFIATVKDEKGEHVKKKVKARSIADIKHYFGDAFVSAQLHDDAQRDDDIANIDKDDAAPVADDQEPDKKLGQSNDGGGEVGGIDEGMDLVKIMLAQYDAKQNASPQGATPYWNSSLPRLNMVAKGKPDPKSKEVKAAPSVDGHQLKTAPYWNAELPRLNTLNVPKKPDPIAKPVTEAKDILISNIRKDHEYFDEMTKLAKKEIADVHGKAMIVSAAKKFRGAGFSVVGCKDGDHYFRIDKADIIKESMITEMAKRVAPAKFWDMAVDAEGIDGAQNLTWAQIKAIADQNDVLIPVYIRDNKLGRARWTAKPKDMAEPAHHPKVVSDTKPESKGDIVSDRRAQTEKEVAAHVAKNTEKKAPVAPAKEEPKSAAPEAKDTYDKSEFDGVHFASASYDSSRELYAAIKTMHGVDTNDTQRLKVGKFRSGPHGVQLGTYYIVKKGTMDALGYWDVTGADMQPGRGFSAYGIGQVALSKKAKKEHSEAHTYGFLMRPQHGTPYISVGTQHSYGPWTKDVAQLNTRDKYEHHEYDDEFGHGTIQVVKVKKVDDKWVKAE